MVVHIQTIWSLLRLNPQSQDRYTDHLDENLPEIEYYFPRYRKTIRPSGYRHPVNRLFPVYPGYVFVRIDPQTGSVHRLISTPIRAYFVKFGVYISTIPDRIIHELKNKESLGLLMQETVVQDPFFPGRKVRVHLPIATIEGIIIHAIGQNRLLVDTKLGRATVHRHTCDFPAA